MRRELSRQDSGQSDVFLRLQAACQDTEGFPDVSRSMCLEIIETVKVESQARQQLKEAVQTLQLTSQMHADFIESERTERHRQISDLRYSVQVALDQLQASVSKALQQISSTMSRDSSCPDASVHTQPRRTLNHSGLSNIDHESAKPSMSNAEQQVEGVQQFVMPLSAQRDLQALDAFVENLDKHDIFPAAEVVFGLDNADEMSNLHFKVAGDIRQSLVANGNLPTQSCSGSNEGSPDTVWSELSIPTEGAPWEQLIQSHTAGDVVTSFRSLQVGKFSRTPRTPREMSWGSCRLATPDRDQDIKIQGEDIANAAKMVERLKQAFNEDVDPQQDICASAPIPLVRPRGNWGAAAARGATTGGISAPRMNFPSAWRRISDSHVGNYLARASGHTTACTCAAEEGRVERVPVPNNPFALESGTAEERSTGEESRARISAF